MLFDQNNLTRIQSNRVLAIAVHKHAKKKLDQYPAIFTEQAWSIKDLLYGIKHQNMINFPCGTKPVSRASKIALSCRSILPVRVANHSGIRFILPALKELVI